MHSNRHDSNKCITIKKKKNTQDTATITKTKSIPNPFYIYSLFYIFKNLFF